MSKQKLISKKIPAFTLMEVTVSMLIAGIAIGITYTAAHIISVTYGDYQKKQDQVAAFMMMDRLLKKDFAGQGTIVKTTEGIQMNMKGQLISYKFEDGYLIRDQYSLGTDTFKLDTKAVSCTFEKEAAADGQHIDELIVQAKLENEEVSLIYHKTYPSQDLIN